MTIEEARNLLTAAGVFIAGESAAIFAEYFEKVYCIDLWDKFTAGGVTFSLDEMREVEEMFDAQCRPFGDKIKKIKCDSVEAAGNFADSSLNLVYLDTNHDYDRVKREIAAWLPKVARGGAIGGHDYMPGLWDGVVKAVDEAFGKYVLKFKDSSWLHRI